MIRGFKHIGRRFLSLFFVLLLLLAVPVPTDAAQEEVWQFKLDEAVRQDFQSNEFVTFLVKMREQVDLAETRAKVSSFALAQATDYETAEINIRNFMVQELQETSKDSQNRLLHYLLRAKNQGLVKEFESFFIVNSLVVTATREVAEQLAKLPEVEKVCEDKEYYIEQTESQSGTAELLAEPSQELPWNLKNIQVDQVWKQDVNGEGVVIGMIDSGADLQHPAIKDSWRGNEPGMEVYSWLDATKIIGQGKPYDEHGHGTHVLGTILGKQGEHGMPLGVAPKAKWIAVKVLDSEGMASVSALLRAGQWIMAPTDENGVPQADKAPKIINNSWGGNDTDEFFREVLKKWREAGILPIFSAGNTRYNLANRPGSVMAPAKYPEAFAVGAVDKDNRIADFSLQGPSEYKETKPEISAPGVNIKSSVPGGGYELKSGTSMASPHVTGVAALLKQVNPALTVDQLEEILIASADPRTDEKFVESPNNGYGHGVLNAARAVEMAKQGIDGLGVLKGRIITKSEDNNLPGIRHHALSAMYKAYLFDLTAEVSDPEGVAEVNFYMKKEADADFVKYSMKLSKGTKLSGLYSVEVDPDNLADAGQNMVYYISAIDVNGQETRMEEVTSVVSNGVGIGYSEDFEDEPEGFYFGGKTPLWEWGKPESGPGRAYSGEKVIGTNLKGRYKGLEDAVLVTPIIDLTNKQSAVLTFQHWYDLDSSFQVFHDTAEVWIGEVKDGDKEAEKTDFKLYRSYRNSQKDWTYEYLDLAGFKGKRIVVMFGLRYGGFSGQRKDGWYIDDLRIEEPSTDVPQTPYQYLEGRYRTDGGYSIYFYKLENPKVTDYVMYRSDSLAGEFKPVQTIKAGEIQYKGVNLTDYAKPQAGEYYYYATARIGDNESKPTQIFKHVFTEGKRVEFFDFEDGDQGWYSKPATGGAIWTRGIADESQWDSGGSASNGMPIKATSKGKNSGDNVWGTELTAYRKANNTYVLTSPVMNLTNVKQGRMYYQNWFNTFGRRGLIEQYGEYYYHQDDWGYVYISRDGGENWELLFELKNKGKEEFGKHRQRGVWYLDHLDIPAEYLTDQFRVQFVLDGYKETFGAGCGGWYIDDFAIYDVADKEITIGQEIELNQADESTETEASTETEVSTETEANLPAKDDEPTAFALENLTLWSQAVAESQSVASGDIPVFAQVLSENGFYAVCEQGSGHYQMKHPTGTYRFVVDEPGYKKAEVQLTITAGQETDYDFILEKADKAGLQLQVTDQKGAPVADATVSLIGQKVHKQETSNAEGMVAFTDLSAGNYWLKIKKAGFESLRREVTLSEGETPVLKEKIKEISIEQEEKELLYDSGDSTESYLGLKNGVTVAVRFSAEKAMALKAAKFFFIPEKGKEVAGKEFQYAVYGASDQDGLAGERLAGPFTAVSQEGGQWTEVRLPEEVLVKGDFYLAYTQVGDKEVTAQLGVDTKADKTKSFIWYDGGWLTGPSKGGFMIRALASEYVVKPIDEPKPNNPGSDPGQTPSPSPAPSPSPSPSPAPSPAPKAETKEPKKEVTPPKKEEKESILRVENVETYSDVKEHWAKNEIAEVVAKGIFKGTSANEFSPNQKTTRAMFFTVLHRISGKAKEEAGKQWYEDGMNWAKEQGISDGSLPMANITREQLITMLYRFVGKPKTEGNLQGFKDVDKVQDFAKEAMLWAVKEGILLGNQAHELSPSQEATRAEVVVILSRYFKKVK